MDTELEDSPASIRLRALKEMVQSEGWIIFGELIERDWGAEEVLRKTEDALKALSGNLDQATVNDTVQQIHAARRAVLTMKQAVYEEMQALSPESQPKPWKFDKFRRAR